MGNEKGIPEIMMKAVMSLYEETTSIIEVGSANHTGFSKSWCTLGISIITVYLQLWLMWLRKELEKDCFMRLSIQTIWYS